MLENLHSDDQMNRQIWLSLHKKWFVKCFACNLPLTGYSVAAGEFTGDSEQGKKLYARMETIWLCTY